MNAVEHLLGAAALERHGARAALLCGEDSVSYAELAAQVRRAANALRGLGIAPGDRVLLLLRDTPEFAAAWLGTIHAGAVAIALNTKLSESEYRYVREDSGARLEIIEDPFARARPDLAAEAAAAGRLLLAGKGRATGRSWREALERAGGEAAPVEGGREAPAFWLYSSGTTGRPKGIIHAHRSILSAGQAQREVLGLGPGDRIAATSKLFFAYALENGLLGPLSLGASTILHPDWAEAEPVAALVERHAPAAFFSVPTFYRRLLGLPREKLAAFGRVRHFVAAGERLPAPVIEQWRSATGRELLSLYGMSETFCVCVMTPPGTSIAPRTGKPLAGVEARRGASANAEPARGEPGELWVRHPALALGYANRPEQTAAQFSGGWFRTGDLFTADAEGFLAHQGRADEMVKIAGQWVQPGELEEAVGADPSIAEVACVPVIDHEGFERLALFVAARGETADAIEAAGRICEAQLPRFKRPKWIRAVGELPRTATGKVQRFRLRELIESELGVAR